LSAGAASDDDDSRLHAFNGAAEFAVHCGEIGAALELCQAALPLTADKVAWRATIGMHASQAHAYALQAALSPNLDDLPTPLEEEKQALDSMIAAAAVDDASAVHAAEAVAEGTCLLLGDAHAARDDPSRAQTYWRTVAPEPADGDGAAAAASAAEPDAAAAARALRQVAARGRLGRALLAGGEPSRARAELTLAVSACEASLPEGHPLLYSSLGCLAASIAAGGEPIEAEGLYRSAIDALQPPPPTPDAPAAPVAACRAPHLLACLDGFASLLDELVWNGKPRAAEAEAARGRADALRAEIALALHGTSDAAALRTLRGGGLWLGGEPWYRAGCGVDWLAAACDESA